MLTAAGRITSLPLRCERWKLIPVLPQAITMCLTCHLSQLLLLLWWSSQRCQVFPDPGQLPPPCLWCWCLTRYHLQQRRIGASVLNWKLFFNRNTTGHLNAILTGKQWREKTTFLHFHWKHIHLLYTLLQFILSGGCHRIHFVIASVVVFVWECGKDLEETNMSISLLNTNQAQK